MSNLLTPNATLANKYVPGDQVWVVFSIGPDIKINQFTLTGFVAQLKPDTKEMEYLYSYQMDGTGKEDGVNPSWAKEELIHFDKKHAEKKAVQMMGDLIAAYRDEMENKKLEYQELCLSNQKKFDSEMTRMAAEMSQINAKHLEVAAAPGQDQPAEPTQNPEEPTHSQAEPTQTETQIKPETNGESEADPVPDKEATPAD